MHNHSHSCSCDHEHVKYCKHCGIVYCCDCNKEWPKSLNYYPYNYWPYTYPYTITYGQSGAGAAGGQQTTTGIWNSQTMTQTACKHGD